MCKALEVRQSAWSRRATLRVLAASWLFGLAATTQAVDVVSESRAIGPFRAVELDGIGELVITQGVREALVIEAERPLLPLLSAQAQQGVLHFDYGGREIRTRAPIRFLVTVRNLERLRLSGSGNCHIGRLTVHSLETELAGSGDLAIESLDAGEFVASISGAGTIDVAGTVARQHVNISGAGAYRAAALHSRRTTAEIAGSGSIEVSVAERLVANIEGSGDIRYRGRPTLDQRISGAGTIERIRDGIL